MATQSVNLAVQDMSSPGNVTNDVNTSKSGEASRSGVPDAKLSARQDRPRVTLPDPLPTKPRKRYPEPVRAELDRKLEKLQQEIKDCVDRLKSHRDIYDQISKVREEFTPRVDAAKNRLHELSNQSRMLIEKKKLLSEQIRNLRVIDKPPQGAASGGSASSAGQEANTKDGHAALRGCRTVQDVDDRIASLESQQMSSSLTLQEEKKIVSQINFLSSKGRDITRNMERQQKEEKEAKDSRIAERKTLEEKRKVLEVEIDAARKAADDQKELFEKLLSDRAEKIRVISASGKDFDRDAEKKRIEEIREEIRRARDAYFKDHDEWFLNELIVVEQAKIARQKRYEAIRAEKVARRKAWEEEQAQYPVADPYQAEKDMCSSLLLLLRGLMGVAPIDTTVKADSSKSSLLPEAADKPTTLGTKKGKNDEREITRVEGSRAIGKSTNAGDTAAKDDDAYGMFAVKTSAKKNRRGRKSMASAQVSVTGSPKPDHRSGGSVARSPDNTSSSEVSRIGLDGSKDGALANDKSKLKPLSIDHLTSFAKLGIKAPTRRCDLPVAYAGVSEKLTYFNNSPPEKDAESSASANGPAGEHESSRASKPMLNGTVKGNGSLAVEGLEGFNAFPELGASAVADGELSEMPENLTSTAEADVSRPSFSDIARGNSRILDQSSLSTGTDVGTATTDIDSTGNDARYALDNGKTVTDTVSNLRLNSTETA